MTTTTVHLTNRRDEERAVVEVCRACGIARHQEIARLRVYFEFEQPVSKVTFDAFKRRLRRMLADVAEATVGVKMTFYRAAAPT